MANMSEWQEWLEARADSLQERYREVWTKLPRRGRRPEPVVHPEPSTKPWCTIHPKIDRTSQEAVILHLELPEPHTVEADVRVIGSTLAIAVLRRGRGIDKARVEECYRRAIPLPPEVDPGSAVHDVLGDELVIRLRPQGTKRGSRKRAATRNGRDPAWLGETNPQDGDGATVPPVKAAPRRRGKRSNGNSGAAKTQDRAGRRPQRGGAGS